MSEYQVMGSGGLKLKGTADTSLKKKKKKKLDRRLMETTVRTTGADSAAATAAAAAAAAAGDGADDHAPAPARPGRAKTQAELAFEKQREKNELKRIMAKAARTHKQQVEDFNKHLDSLTEHFDIPKVSWTK